MAWNPNVPTVTNRVQDDLNAIRQNFEELDGLPQDKTNILELAGEKDNILGHLADTSNPHNVQAQQVPYSSGVSGFTPADVKAALDALAGVRIVEMGSNSNGEYVRWENGLQVCWRQDQLGAVQDFPDTFNNLADRIYPAMFSSPPVAQISVGVQSDSSSIRGAFYIAGVSGSSGWNRLCLVRHGSATGSTQGVNAFFVAIGRWK